MSKPYFSIITCTYNSKKYLLECLKSVEQQKFKDYEHILIDGFSKDGTIKILKNYLKRNKPRVRFYQFTAQGITKAINQGVKLAKGQIVSHLHSDDYLYNNKVLKIVEEYFKQNKNVQVIVGNCYVKRGDKRKSYWRKNYYSQLKRKIKWLSSLYLINYNFIPHPSTYIKKEVFKKFGLFNPKFKIAMDYEYWLRIFKVTNFYFLNDYLTIYRDHPKTASSNISLRNFEDKLARTLHRQEYKKEELIFNSIFKPVIKIINSLKN